MKSLNDFELWVHENMTLTEGRATVLESINDYNNSFRNKEKEMLKQKGLITKMYKILDNIGLHMYFTDEEINDLDDLLSNE